MPSHSRIEIFNQLVSELVGELVNKLVCDDGNHSQKLRIVKIVVWLDRNGMG